MWPSWFSVIVGAGAIAALPVLAETIPGSEFAAGLWRGAGSPANDRGVVSCFTALDGVQGDQVMFNLGSDNRFLLALTLPQGTFRDGETLDVSIWTNVEPAIAVPATAANAATLLVAFTDIDWVARYLQDSQMLTVTGETFQHSFSIANANLALEAAKTCLADNAPD